MVMKRFVISALLSVTVASLAFGDTMAAPAHQANFFTRVLAHDGALKQRAGKSVTVAVIYKKGQGSIHTGMRIIQAFFTVSPRFIQGLPIRAMSYQFRSGNELAQYITKEEIDVLYVPPGFTEELAVITSVAREKRVVPVTPVREYVRQGLAMGVVQEGDKPRLLLNLEAAREFGMEPDGAVLAAAEVVH
jgi:hypothetical protein